MRRLVAVSSLVFATSAFAQPPAGDPAPADASAAPTAPASAADRAHRARVYARIGDRTITVGDLEDAIAAQTPFQRQRYLDDPSKLRELAALMVDREVLAAEAERRHLERSPRAEEAIQGDLVQVLMQRTVDARISPESIATSEVEAYYAAHPDEFSRPEMVRASHVLLANEGEAQAMIERCRTSDIASFRQWARDQSLDTETKQSGGDLRYFTRDGRPVGTEGRPVAGGLVAAAFAIDEVGHCADSPVVIDGRASVVLLTGRRTAETTSLAAAEPVIRRKLWRTQRAAALEALVSRLRTASPVEVHPERLAGLAPVTGPTRALGSSVPE